MAGHSGEAGNEALGGRLRGVLCCCCTAPPLQLRGFFSVTPVQQSLLLLLGSLAYDAGSVAYLVDLLPASIFFLAASALFVVALGLDIRQIREQAAEALTCPDPDVRDLLARNAWRRWLALALNSAGGIVSFLGAVTYLRASAEVVNYHGEEELLRRGDALFATGMWLFCAGFALIVHDTRHTVVAISRIKGEPVPRYDSTLRVYFVYLGCLIVFGIASTLFVLPNDSTQLIAVALFVVSNVSFTLINMLALWFLWRAHCMGEAGTERGAETGDGEGDVEAAPVGGGSADGALPQFPRRLGSSRLSRRDSDSSLHGGMEAAGWSASPREVLELSGLLHPLARTSSSSRTARAMHESDNG